MKSEIADILRSPAGLPVQLEGNILRDAAGAAYRYENDVAFLYDEPDISPFLLRDMPRFQASHAVSKHDRGAQWAVIESNYKRARAINTGFMFSILRYENPEGRRVAEIGVGACDLIRRFAKKGFQAIAVDFFPWEMQTAHEETLQAGEPGFTCVSAPMAKLPFADESLDLVYFHAALHHALPLRHEDFAWYSPDNLLDCLKEVRRVLKSRENGGAFFLLGEGIYPEHYENKDRIEENKCIETPDLVYEAWYKISEYEEIYKKTGLYPNIFLWQDSFTAEALGYSDSGERIEILSRDDMVSDGNYWRVSEELARHADAILPSWIKVDVLADPFAAAFAPGGRLAAAMHTVCGRPAKIDDVPVFTADVGAQGYLLYGPYVALEAGRYAARFAVRGQGQVTFDVLSSLGPLAQPVVVALQGGAEWQAVVLEFDVPAGAEQIETRALIAAPGASEIHIASAVVFDRGVG